MSDYMRMGQRTAYNGICFDSLTEARWAMYFDKIGMPYEREPETFEFPAEDIDIGGINYTTGRLLYTPDFFLPDQDVYIEVKRGNANDGTALKLGMLATRGGKPGMILDGPPRNFSVHIFSPEPLKPEERHYSDYNGFSCDYFFNHHQMTPAKDFGAEQRDKLINLYNEIADHEFFQPTQEQIIADHNRHRLLMQNPTVLPKRSA